MAGISPADVPYLENEGEARSRFMAWGARSRRVWSFLTRDKFAMTGIMIYAVLLLVALLAPFLARFNPQAILADAQGNWIANQPPSSTFLLGTTNAGRDIFSQLIYGTRPAIIVGFTAAFFVSIIGTIVGVVAGYYGGRVDNLLMRITDIAFGIPFEPFIIVLVAMLKPGLTNIVLAIALLLWRDTARVIRSQVLSVRERSFVEAARVSGAGNLRIMLLYITPNILPLSFLYGSLAIGWAILAEAAVSFLGFGDPNVISWGYMLQDAYVSQAMSRGAYYWIIPPGVCIMLAVMAGFFIGRGYEEILFPRLRER